MTKRQMPVVGAESSEMQSARLERIEQQGRTVADWQRQIKSAAENLSWMKKQLKEADDILLQLSLNDPEQRSLFDGSVMDGLGVPVDDDEDGDDDE